MKKCMKLFALAMALVIMAAGMQMTALAADEDTSEGNTAASEISGDLDEGERESQAETQTEAEADTQTGDTPADTLEDTPEAVNPTSNPDTGAGAHPLALLALSGMVLAAATVSLATKKE